MRKKLVKIGTKIVIHARYVTFQMAEVAVPRKLFTEILELIDGLRSRLAPSQKPWRRNAASREECAETPRKLGEFSFFDNLWHEGHNRRVENGALVFK